MKRKSHRNIHLQRAYNSYGNCFEFKMLEEIVDSSMLTKREQYWIDKLNTLDRNFGYNLKEAGDGGKLTEEVKRRISEGNKGKTLSNETRKKISEAEKGATAWNKGMKMDESFSEMLSKRFKGQTPWNKDKKWPRRN